MFSLSGGIFYEGCEEIYVLKNGLLYKKCVMLMRPGKFIHVHVQVEYEQWFCNFSVWETFNVSKYWWNTRLMPQCRIKSKVSLI
jgi:hypothetical protein